MCTIIALFGVRQDFPLVLATNRDEFYQRPSTGPVRLMDSPKVVGGRDLLASGTWMGVTEAGLFVGLTNQRRMRPPEGDKRSRGELVMQALSLETPARIRRWVEALDASAYQGFNLMFGDARELYVAYGRESPHVEVEQVPKGLHLLPNDRLDSPAFWKVERARTLLAPYLTAPFEQLCAALKRTLGDTEMPALSELPELPEGAPYDRPMLQRLAALCVRTPVYGTRSSTIVALREGGVSHYLYADGPPDQAPFRDVRGLFAAP
jgi:uncharacterized protein with NRDE domain